MGMLFMLEIDYDLFISNLAKTQEYCHRQMSDTVEDDTIIDRASLFRSFNPEVGEREIFEFRLEEYRDSNNNGLGVVKTVNWTTDPHQNYSLIEDLYHDQQAFKEKCLPGFSLQTRYFGEIVISEIDISVTDGASAADSYYLFDDCDLPPIDTWFYLLNKGDTRLIFAWIPDEYKTLVEDAIAVNCVECIGWFREMFPDDYIRFYNRFWQLNQQINK